MNGLMMAGMFLAILGLSFGFLYKVEKQSGPRRLTNRGHEGGDK